MHRGLQRSANQLLLLRSKSTKKDTSSLLDTISSLRWRIATSLTESLPQEQQEELLTRLKIEPQKPQQEETPAVEDPQKSIAEAVALARVEEAKKLASKWEEEKGRLEAEFEAAAQKRLETELAIQHRKLNFEKWQQELEAAKRSKKHPHKKPLLRIIQY